MQCKAAHLVCEAQLQQAVRLVQNQRSQVLKRYKKKRTHACQRMMLQMTQTEQH